VLSERRLTRSSALHGWQVCPEVLPLQVRPAWQAHPPGFAFPQGPPTAETHWPPLLAPETVVVGPLVDPELEPLAEPLPEPTTVVAPLVDPVLDPLAAPLPEPDDPLIGWQVQPAALGLQVRPAWQAHPPTIVLAQGPPIPEAHGPAPLLAPETVVETPLVDPKPLAETLPEPTTVEAPLVEPFPEPLATPLPPPSRSCEPITRGSSVLAPQPAPAPTAAKQSAAATFIADQLRRHARSNIGDLLRGFVVFVPGTSFLRDEMRRRVCFSLIHTVCRYR
jgi:hypothetical protein